MTPEEEIQQDVQKGINTATIGIMRFLMVHLAMRTPPDVLPELSEHFSAMRHDQKATDDLGLGGMESYNVTYDHVEAALIEVINLRE